MRFFSRVVFFLGCSLSLSLLSSSWLSSSLLSSSWPSSNSLQAQQRPQEYIAPNLTGENLQQFILQEYAVSNPLGYNGARDQMYGTIDNVCGVRVYGNNYRYFYRLFLINIAYTNKINND